MERAFFIAVILFSLCTVSNAFYLNLIPGSECNQNGGGYVPTSKTTGVAGFCKESGGNIDSPDLLIHCDSNAANSNWTLSLWSPPSTPPCSIGTATLTITNGSSKICKVATASFGGNSATFAIYADCSREDPATSSYSSSSSCFPATATVILADGTTTEVQHLKVGDNVLVANKETASQVFMFSHRYPNATSEFTQLHTAAGSSITLSHGHYLYVNNVLATAASAKVGDKLDTVTGTTTITSTQKVQATGLYNPHTLHGDIFVNGIRTSTYTDAINPVLAHSLLAPARAMYSLGYDLNKN